ncbi:uncharacterized protein LOC111374861 [Olea europaea var. sylvestris]|uniref:uncharacterized protein LOC111374861 n=1 Tax=Olea europaea var. sylvestris TaxID=158386 RepID=UPI000C1D2EC0|nr:uncharacterized protein LOC111374861 [Olea europaea var. sylvestris]
MKSSSISSRFPLSTSFPRLTYSICIQISFNTFISYQHLSPTYLAFTSSISLHTDPKHINRLSRTKTGVRKKARLVAKGFTQQQGVDYRETFSPVAKMVTVKTLLALATIRGWHLQQFDFNNAFLHGELNEEIYMKRPPGYNKGKSGQVYKLLRSLYGLKQASRQWYSKFSTFLISFGFIQSKLDYSLFTWSDGEHFTALLVYVDDIAVASNSLDSINMIKEFLNQHFKIKDLENLRYFLGIEVARSPLGIHLCQRKYTLDILADSGILGSKPTKIPIEQNQGLSKDSGLPLPDPSVYRRLIGRLLYLTITRPDISYSVQTLSQFMAHPSTIHLAVADKILKYLKRAPGQGIILSSSSSLSLQGYCDSDWASCPDTRRSTTGFCIFLGNSLISWKSKMQSIVSRCSAEAEYRAMSTTCSKFTWLRQLLVDLKVDHP